MWGGNREKSAEYWPEKNSKGPCSDFLLQAGMSQLLEQSHHFLVQPNFKTLQGRSITYCTAPSFPEAFHHVPAKPSK